MSSQNLLNLKAELEAAQAELLPQIEGLHDFARLNIKPETLAKVQEAIVDFERRRDLQVSALAALDSLEADNYPEVPLRSVLAEVYADLQDNVTTIEAAFAKFAPVEEAVTAEIVAGAPELKP